MSKATAKQLRTAGVPCPCGCGEEHVRIVGEVHWPELDRWQFYFALLAHQGEQRNVWFALGGAPNAADDRQGYVSVLSFRTGDDVISRITDASESPHRDEPLFVDRAARLVDRDEVFPRENVREWVFASIDDIIASDPSVRAFLLPDV